MWAGELDAVWTPDERCRVMRRRLSRREQLVRSRSRAKNEIHAVLVRRLVGKPPMSDLFGVKGREWLRSLELPVEECETVEGCMRHVELLDAEIAAVERQIAREALGSEEIRQVMSVPGVNVIAAATFMAAIGDIRRFGQGRGPPPPDGRERRRWLAGSRLRPTPSRSARCAPFRRRRRRAAGRDGRGAGAASTGSSAPARSRHCGRLVTRTVLLGGDRLRRRAGRGARRRRPAPAGGIRPRPRCAGRGAQP